MTDEERCSICGKNREQHQELETQRVIHHQFSSNGELLEIDRTPKNKSQQEVMVVPGADILLRRLLLEKGVLSESDFLDSGAAGVGLVGDRPTGPPSETD